MQTPVIKIENLNKSFSRKIFGSKTEALKNINLSINEGQVVGLLGANGAGKSTLLRIIVGLYIQNSGECLVYNQKSSKLTSDVVSKIGYIDQENELINWMTVKNLITFVSAHYKTWNNKLEEEFLSKFNLPLNSVVGKLSPGQYQQLSILLATAFDPSLLILDEPAAYLDTLARAEFIEMILNTIQKSDKTVVISSHILSDIEKVIDHVIILDNGELLENKSLDDLKEEYLKINMTSINGTLPTRLPFEQILECKRNDKNAYLIIKNKNDLDFERIKSEMNCNIEKEYLSLEQLYILIVKNHKGVKI